MMKRFNNITFYTFIGIIIIVIISIIYLGIKYRELDTYSLVLSILGAGAATLAYITSSANYLKGVVNDEKEKNTIQERREKKKNIKDEDQALHFQDEEQETIEDPTMMSQREIYHKGYAYEDFISLRRRDVILHFRKTEKRLKDEIDRLSRRANVNLIIGTLIAFVGVVGLIAFILGETENGRVSEMSYIIVHWVTRLSLVSFVEIFAFFFLKMYKTSLLSIQYFQDELTSIESRKIALMFSIIHDSHEDISKSIECLVNVDRNYKLDSSQTTVNLEKLKNENTFIKTQMESIIDILKDALSFNLKR